MSIDRVASNSSEQYMLSQIMRANNALNKSQAQVASGKVSTDYAGIGDKTAALEAARSASDRANAYMASNQLALTQTDLQNAQLTSLAGLASQLQQAVQKAAGNSDGTNLIDTAKTVFDQAKAILNSTDANGNYIYGGQKSNTPPFTATDISQLNSQPIANFFVNGNTAKSVQTGDGQSQQIGVLASNVGQQLMSALNTLYQQDLPSGTLSGSLTTAQVNNLTANVLPQVTQSVSTINAAAAANGDAYKSINSAITDQQAVKNLYDGFVSNIQDVDMATAITQLNSNQTALQAALQVTARLGSLSLLNYLPSNFGA